ncbi:MAG: hypothetical protein ACM3PT_05860 [Deltaproteobacteria bacterium]
MKPDTVNWAEVYKSLNIETIKSSGKWILIATLIVGGILIISSFLIFRKQPVVGIFMTVGVLIFSGRYALGLMRLNKNPKVLHGIVIDKYIRSRTNEGTYTETVNHYIKMDITDYFEINSDGITKSMDDIHIRNKWLCSPEIYNKIIIGETIQVLVMPHDNTITRIFKN